MEFNEARLYEMVGAEIRGARVRTTPRMSQATVAKRLGISRASMVNIEAGRQHAPLHLLWRIAEILDTELALLVPSRAEYLKCWDVGDLEPAVAEFIESYSDGDPATRRMLTDFVRKARSRADEHTAS